MQSGDVSELDIIEELRLRRWARENYVPAELRTSDWHSIVLDEMVRKDRELNDAQTVTSA
ncbi:MAG: hypothetical protein EBV06_00400 [Planctomycetia bacterium]|nr:hypothetical protein [Planctomycetia bacterium]